MTKTEIKAPCIGTYVDDEEKALSTVVQGISDRSKCLITSAGRKNYISAAPASMNESRVEISRCIAQSDLQRLKAKALREGMPDQTLIGSILHKAVQ